jgi:pimeloyl-ACP methyl ester carboxylesterase
MLVIHGTSDRIVPFSHARSVADHAPNVQLHSIDGGEHVALFTHLDEVRKTAEQFFQQHGKMQ